MSETRVFSRHIIKGLSTFVDKVAFTVTSVLATFYVVFIIIVHKVDAHMKRVTVSYYYKNPLHRLPEGGTGWS